MSEIDPQEFGRLTAKVEHLEKEVAELRTDVRHMVAMLEQARGGWKLLMLVGGVAGAVGAAIGKAASWWMAIGPKG